MCRESPCEPSSGRTDKAASQATDALSTENRLSKVPTVAKKPLGLQEVEKAALAGNKEASKALADIERLQRSAGSDLERSKRGAWGVMHRLATQQGRDQYIDPATGFSVFTATCLKQKACCGYSCRHCPHGAGPKGQLTDLERQALDW
mmetsp:Transcript_7763/g.13777  ORF Transcript_7763/g.13777 Transcript_7763/m.13777 type:complete len:148 (-) Transcript_7763:253-696(-)|eukprot:CAMPEP_0197648756 /NCGR_PEP_ID=MMETSP1338-20131121/27943_1 /TAXON_ID=43686 ORGANISM="Pelagodinium beii, Strain RCC1491" /NCGR_SAMPLE_ID=MMETSP1338 /ASSEMBLY_ACC=CAM_ASM_000754 /LENGTH=147 /DNA_ID=CAMNT_0043222809 /DNA_START=21 /DNA_END=464 /DNA_ORIENTATION=+